jgi:hypothetical protein
VDAVLMSVSWSVQMCGCDRLEMARLARSAVNSGCSEMRQEDLERDHAIEAGVARP